MKLAIIAASGKVGTRLVDEAIQRHHDVTAFVRDASKVTQAIPIVEKDIFSLTSDDFKGFDGVINAFGSKDADPYLYQSTTLHFIACLKDHPKLRYIVVGGAGSLYTDVSLTQQVYQQESFPSFIYPTASNMAKALDLLRKSTLAWTFFSPAIEFDVNGPKTGHYKLGAEYVIYNSQGKSYISYADYVSALFDEVKQAQFIRKRFTAVSEQS